MKKFGLIGLVALSFFLCTPTSLGNVQLGQFRSEYYAVAESDSAEQVNGMSVSGSKPQGDVLGVTVFVKESDTSIEEILATLQVRWHTTYMVDGVAVIEGYSPKLFGWKSVSGKRVNFQIACQSQQFVIGSPVILGSF